MLHTLQTRFYTDWAFYRRVLAITLPIAIQKFHVHCNLQIRFIFIFANDKDTFVQPATGNRYFLFGSCFIKGFCFYRFY